MDGHNAMTIARWPLASGSKKEKLLVTRNFTFFHSAYFSIYTNFEMSFTTSFKLDQSKILLSGNGLTFRNTFSHLIYVWLCHLKILSICTSQKYCCVEQDEVCNKQSCKDKISTFLIRVLATQSSNS